MYDIRQFRPTLYVLVALGFTGFAIATLAPIMWMLGMAGLILNVWLVKTRRFRPLPRWSANALTLGLAGITTFAVIGDPRPIFPIGNFLLVLQLIKLFEQRANRDYAQVLVLSLLLMVAAAISTASLIFGLLFIAYLLLSPYACLLFHLKVETDHAKRLMGLDERQADPMTLKQDQRYLNRSMTRLTGLVATAATIMAVCVFIFFPRGSAANVFNWRYQPVVPMTGLSDQMDMKSVSRVQTNTTQIASVKITHNGELVKSGEIYLRGNVFDQYDGDPNSSTAWSWSRSSLRDGSPQPDTLQVNADSSLLESDQAEATAGGEQWVQEFAPLQPIYVPFLVAIGRPISLSANRPLKFNAISRDQTITLTAPLFQPLNYRVVSTLPIVATPVIRRPNDNGDDGAPPALTAISPRVAEYARRPEVSGTDAGGRPLAVALARQIAATPTPMPIPRNRAFAVRLPRAPELAAEVAAKIEQHLQTEFAYTLDLADDRTKDDRTDPVERFLYVTKKGWCEHFAGAMTLMCQSLGLQARLVSGYKCDEYNAIGDYFIVRQSHAHAWVEVLIRDGNRDIWERFDPTSGHDVTDAAAAGPSSWMKVKHFFEFLEHTWATNVVAYDAGTQSSLLDNVETKMLNVSIQANSAVKDQTGGWQDWLDRLKDKKYSIGESAIIGMLTLFITIGVGLTAWFVVGRVRLMRRARRIGLGSLERDEARRLARQLGFYDEMIGILEQREIVCPAHMTPLEFGRSLDFLPREAYEIVCRLTSIFYRVRFGTGKLSLGQRRSLTRVVDRLRGVLVPEKRVAE